MQLEFVWFYCPEKHPTLIDYEQVFGMAPIYCVPCSCAYFVDEGELGEKEYIDEAFPNLRG